MYPTEVSVIANQDHLSKNELIQWINDLLKIKITRIETLGTGAIYCQILDAIHPTKVQVQKLNWKAKYDYEFIQNFQILHQTFNYLQINKSITIKELVKCKQKENLELIQWMKKYFDAHEVSRLYDPVQRRGNQEVDFSSLEKRPLRRESTINMTTVKIANSLTNTSQNLQTPKLNFSKVQNSGIQSKNSSFSNISYSNTNENSPIKQNVLADLQNPSYLTLKQERDHYFQKLKDIQHILEVNQAQDVDILQKKIQDILLCTPDKVVQIQDDGEIVIQSKQQEDFNSILYDDDQIPTFHNDLNFPGDLKFDIDESNFMNKDNMHVKMQIDEAKWGKISDESEDDELNKQHMTRLTLNLK